MGFEPIILERNHHRLCIGADVRGNGKITSGAHQVFVGPLEEAADGEAVNVTTEGGPKLQVHLITFRYGKYGDDVPLFTSVVDVELNIRND